MIKSNQKNGLRIVEINLILFALLFGIISVNKEYFRPTFNHIPFVEFLTDVFPNFITAYLISLAFVNAVLFRKPTSGRLIVFASSLIVFIILTIEEFKSIWGASIFFDLFDIIASGLGSLLAILTFEFISRKQRHKEN